MKLQRLLFFFTIIFFSQSIAHAALQLELTQGVDRALPIAITPFAGQQTSDGSQSISAVISADLQNSGRFRLVSGNQQPQSIQSIDYPYWKSQGADDIVVGKVTPLSSSSSQVKFDLLDPLSNNHMLVSKVYTVNNNELRRLAHHISDIIYQQLTGDRGIFSTRIAYVLVNRTIGKAQYRLMVADYDGYHPQTLLVSSQPIMSPAWSPNAKQIAYVSFENKRAQIYVATVASGQRRLVTSFPGINGAPAWSPNGQQLAVALSKSGHLNIYTVNLASSALTQLTHGASIDTEPNWAPDGKSIIFTSDRGGSPQIYQVNLAGGNISRVTYSGNYNARASFTANGQNIVVLNGGSSGYNIAIQGVSSGQLVNLTRSGQDQSPSVAPNGKMVIYANRSGNTSILSVVSTDGKVRLRLPAQGGDVQEPAWSPFIG